MIHRDQLSTELSDLEWFTTFCGLLARDRKPTLGYACGLLRTPRFSAPAKIRRHVRDKSK